LVRRRENLPRVGELVIGTVRKVFDYGAYLVLDEFNGREAYLPWSEVSSKWVRDVKDFVREGQKAVVKVIRVDRRRGHIDVSMKRVNSSEQRRKMLEFKRAQRAEKLIEMAARRIGKNLDDAYNEVGWLLEDRYGEIYAGLEEAAYRGEEAFREAGISEEWIQPLMEEIKKHIKVKRIRIRGILTLWSLKPDGVQRLKKVMLEPLKKVGAGRDTLIRIYTLGAPRYRVEVTSTEYKKAEKALASYIANVQRLSKKLGLNFSYQRERI